jgi:hypothetical protein
MGGWQLKALPLICFDQNSIHGLARQLLPFVLTCCRPSDFASFETHGEPEDKASSKAW